MKYYLLAVLSILPFAANASAEKVTVTMPGISVNVQEEAKGDSEAPAPSSGITISVSGSDDYSSEKINYKCGDQNVIATYINADDISLVQLDIADKTIVAANVLSASGAKYAGDQYYWWEHQGEVSLYNITEDPEQKNPVTCLEQENDTGE